MSQAGAKAPTGGSSLPAGHAQLGMTAAKAVAIYKAKANKTHRTSGMLSELCSVSPKAVRDVWTLRTWTRSTMPYWSAQDRANYEQREQPGALLAADELTGGWEDFLEGQARRATLGGGHVSGEF